MIKKHVVITGAGRSGTTFLVELLSHLGLDTGFSTDDLKVKKDHLANAGLEFEVGANDAPYIVKDPWFCDYVEKVLARSDILIEHVFIPIREIEAVAASRRLNQKKGYYQLTFKKRLMYKIWPYPLSGGLWDTQSHKKGKQEAILSKKLYHALFALSKEQIPITFINFELMTSQSQYLYEKLSPILKNTVCSDFDKAFQKSLQPHLIHDFNGR